MDKVNNPSPYDTEVEQIKQRDKEFNHEKQLKAQKRETVIFFATGLLLFGRSISEREIVEPDRFKQVATRYVSLFSDDVIDGLL